MALMKGAEVFMVDEEGADVAGVLRLDGKGDDKVREGELAISSAGCFGLIKINNAPRRATAEKCRSRHISRTSCQEKPSAANSA